MGDRRQYNSEANAMWQLIIGLAAGIVVGLVMEWMIDWSGFTVRSGVVASAGKRNVAETSPHGRVHGPGIDTPTTSDTAPEKTGD